MTREDLKEQVAMIDTRDVLARADMECALNGLLTARNHLTAAMINNPRGTSGALAEIVSRILAEPTTMLQTYLAEAR